MTLEPDLLVYLPHISTRATIPPLLHWESLFRFFYRTLILTLIRYLLLFCEKLWDMYIIFVNNLDHKDVFKGHLTITPLGNEF